MERVLYEGKALQFNGIHFGKSQSCDQPVGSPVEGGMQARASKNETPSCVCFRILYCTGISHNDLNTVHHELGHVYYFIEYKNQPVEFRDGANPGVGTDHVHQIQGRVRGVVRVKALFTSV